MIKNYIKTAFRNLRKNKSFSLINISGLAIGIAGCLIIFLYISDQLSYDKFYKHSKNIYRLVLDIKSGNTINKYSTTSPPMGPYLVQNFPEVKEAVRVRIGSASLMESNKFKAYEENIIYADSNFFNLFSFPFSEGNPLKALREPNSVVLTPETAKRYFGDENPIGKIIKMDKRFSLKITGIISPEKFNSHIKFDFLISFSTFPSTLPPGYSINDWGWTSFFTYLLINNNTDVKKLERKLPGFIKDVFSRQTAERLSLHLEPLENIYFDNERIGDFGISGNKTSLYLIGIIAVLSLIIALFNFINLSTAKSINRGKEVGIRKVLGANRRQLIKQFLGESIIIVLFSLLVSLVLIEILIPIISSSLSLHISLSDFRLVYILIFILVFPIFIGTIAGIFPAFILSNFIPSKILKGKFNSWKSGISLRKVLIIIQFFISTLLITGTLIVSRQMNFIRNKNLGFDKDKVIVLKLRGEELLNRFETIKSTMSNITGIISVGGARNGLDGNFGSNSIFIKNDKKNELERYDINIYPVNYGFFKTLDIKFISGRSFSKSFASDSNSFILNESAVRFFGIKEPLNLEARFGNGPQGKIIGVVKDFNYTSLHNKIEPLVFYLSLSNSENMFLKIRGNNTLNIIQMIKEKWNQLLPNYPLKYSFLDERIDRIYKSDEIFAALTNYFSCLAIIIACVGLFGLISFSTEQRRKEIGIRKVLGSSIPDIIKLLTFDYLRLIFISVLIAFPLSYYLMNSWLQNYAFRIEISLWIFIIALLIIFLTAGLTISYHIIKAAVKNPVESLRYE
ncbi:MAG: ABC transporter permease [Ignavibacteriaceae bacterium]